MFSHEVVNHNFWLSFLLCHFFHLIDVIISLMIRYKFYAFLNALQAILAEPISPAHALFFNSITGYGNALFCTAFDPYA
jgi:hypothetical protein